MMGFCYFVHVILSLIWNPGQCEYVVSNTVNGVMLIQTMISTSVRIEIQI